VVDVLTIEELVILKWQKPLWEGDQEVVKRSGRYEPMWVSIHKYMEAMLGISLNSYLYLKLAKNPCLSIISHVFFSTKSENKRAELVLPGCRGWGGEEGGTNNVYTCKSKNDKIKGEKIK
jgi:hypothetical protein